MKRNIPLLAAAVSAGIFCVWSYLAAQPAGEKESPAAKKSLLEIKEPSQEDFEHCAKRAVDFLESWSEDQTQMDIAMHELLGVREMDADMKNVSRRLAAERNKIKYGYPKLIAKKSFGENFIVLYYHYQTDGPEVIFRFDFVLPVDQNDVPKQWRCYWFAPGYEHLNSIMSSP